jgi:hypothetical protein
MSDGTARGRASDDQANLGPDGDVTLSVLAELAQ